MDPKNKSVCELCNVIFHSDKMKEQHLHGKKHLLAVHQASSAKKKQECGIFVTGLPNMVPKEEIIGLFETYGKVVSSYVGENCRFCIIQFDSPASAEHLISLQSLRFKGKTIKICRRAIKQNDPVKATYEAPLENIDKIINGLKNIPTFNDQLKWLIGQIQPGYEETRSKIYRLCNDLQSVLNEKFVDCRIHTFGSTVTNLHLLNSDIDIYVQVRYPNTHNTSNTSLASTYVNDSKKLLLQYGNIFSSVCAIPNAKTPIVKFVHNYTNLKCDFNFKNMLGVCNSQLIHYYLLLDYKLTPLMIFLKFWAKSRDLIGLGGKFSNYTLALMFIFYMQQSVYHLPPVAVLQTDGCVNMQNGWNGGFKRIQTYSRVLSEHGMVRVILGFFQYYATFDYTLNTICPYLGKTVFKTDFLKPETLPSIFQLYTRNVGAGVLPLKIDSPICVQDPFELNHNVSCGVNSDYLEEFTSLCKIAIVILQDTLHIQDAMYKLLTEEPEVFTRKAVVNDNEIRFKLSLSSVLLRVNDIVALKKIADKDKQVETVHIWQHELKVMVLKLLKDLMKFTVILENEDKPYEKTQRVCGQTDIHDIVKGSTLCYGFYNLWDGRKTMLKDMDIDNSASLFDQQLHITKYILDVLYKGKVLDEKIIQFKIQIKFNEVPAEATFSVKNVNSKQGNFKRFGVYFLKILPLLLEAQLIGISKTLNDSEKLVTK